MWGDTEGAHKFSSCVKNGRRLTRLHRYYGQQLGPALLCQQVRKVLGPLLQAYPTPEALAAAGSHRQTSQPQPLQPPPPVVTHYEADQASQAATSETQAPTAPARQGQGSPHSTKLAPTHREGLSSRSHRDGPNTSLHPSSSDGGVGGGVISQEGVPGCNSVGRGHVSGGGGSGDGVVDRGDNADSQQPASQGGLDALESILRPLGLYRVRARGLVRFSWEYLHKQVR